MAREMAHQVVQPRPIGVWDVLIPIVFILSFLDQRRRRQVFTQNFLFTRQLALDAAMEMVAEGSALEQALVPIRQKTDTLLTEAEAVYTESIRDRQMEEIRLLMVHYQRLLGASGDRYETLVAQVYGTPQDYQAFLDRLHEAEDAVTAAARQSLGSRVDPVAARAMEKARALARKKEIERVFPASVLNTT